MAVKFLRCFWEITSSQWVFFFPLPVFVTWRLLSSKVQHWYESRQQNWKSRSYPWRLFFSLQNKTMQNQTANITSLQKKPYQLEPDVDPEVARGRIFSQRWKDTKMNSIGIRADWSFVWTNTEILIAAHKNTKETCMTSRWINNDTIPNINSELSVSGVSDIKCE